MADTVREMAERIDDDYDASMNDVTSELYAVDYFESAIRLGIKEGLRRASEAVREETKGANSPQRLDLLAGLWKAVKIVEGLKTD